MNDDKAKRDQHIALCADSREEAVMLMPAARHMSSCLKKGIIVFTCSDDGKEWVEEQGEPYAALHADWPTAVEAMPTAFNVVLAIVLVDPKAPRQSNRHPRQLLKNFRQSKIAYMAVPMALAKQGQPFTTQRVALTLNHTRESKEKLLWTSYLARFCQSSVTAYHLPYKDPSLRTRCENNFRYMEKIFSTFKIAYTRQPLDGGNQFADPDPKTIEAARADVYIALVSDDRDRDLLDLLSTPPAQKLLQHAASSALLLVNSRDDLYILCD